MIRLLALVVVFFFSFLFVGQILVEQCCLIDYNICALFVLFCYLCGHRSSRLDTKVPFWCKRTRARARSFCTATHYGQGAFIR